MSQMVQAKTLLTSATTAPRHRPQLIQNFAINAGCPVNHAPQPESESGHHLGRSLRARVIF
jgi:hypothetical protein